MLNRFELIGNLTHAPELRYSPQGSPYCFLRLATNRYSGGQQWTDFHFVTIWYGHAERSAQSLSLGDRVYVEGRIESTPSDREEDGKLNRIRLIGARVLFLDRKRTERRPNIPPNLQSLSKVIAAEKTATEPEVRETAEDSA